MSLLCRKFKWDIYGIDGIEQKLDSWRTAQLPMSQRDTAFPTTSLQQSFSNGMTSVRVDLLNASPEVIGKLSIKHMNYSHAFFVCVESQLCQLKVVADPSQIHPRSIVPQPVFAFLEIRHDFIHFVPECGGMIWVDQVSQFMDDDVIDDR